jgi:hypothetical protein
MYNIGLLERLSLPKTRTTVGVKVTTIVLSESGNKIRITKTKMGQFIEAKTTRDMP